MIYFNRQFSKIFLEEDFCIYSNFPFNQLIILYLVAGFNNNESTCTYLWLVQYYKQYLNIYKDNNEKLNILMKELNSSAFKSISKCNFEQKVTLCNKSNYEINDIWDRSDFFILNKKLQIQI